MKVRLVLISIFLVIGCENSPNKSRVIKNWQQEWKLDSLGCLGLRSSIYYNHYELIEKDILGKSKRMVLENLGSPNLGLKEKNVEYLEYFLVEGIQCIDSTETQVDVMRLVLESIKGKISSLKVVIP